MKKLMTFAVLGCLIFSCARQRKFSELRGDYMGQTPPGATPKVFAPGVFNNDVTGGFCTVFSGDLKEFYFVDYLQGIDYSGKMSRMTQTDGVWSPPETLPFDGDNYDNDMTLSADGNRLIWRSWRELPGGEAPEGHSWLWCADKAGAGWTEAIPVLCGGKPVRTGYPSLAADGTLYFGHRRPSDRLLGIFRSHEAGDAYSEPEYVTTIIDTSFVHGDMYVAPDESYVIISCIDRTGETSFGTALDLYIAFQRKDGTWTRGVNMGSPVNTENGENCPQVTPDGKYLFFNRYDTEKLIGEMMWVDAGIIGRLEKESL